MRDYLFYFDESMHDRNINIDANGLLNVWKTDRAHDKYVGCFIGWPIERIKTVEAKYLQFEQTVRQMLGLCEAKEVKSTIFRNVSKRFTSGLASFSNDMLRFYQMYFEYLHHTNAIWQINIVSKLDVFVRKSLFLTPFQWVGVPDRAILYSIIKFLQTYADEQLCQVMSDYCRGSIEGYQFKRGLLQRIDAVLAADENVFRKRAEYVALSNVREILKQYRFIGASAKIQFDYMCDGLGLAAFLSDLDIIKGRTHIVIDNEQQTYDAISQFFSNVEQTDSSLCFGVRAADILAGFVARMLVAINCAVCDVKSDAVLPKASEVLLQLPEEWMNLSETAFKLYRLLSNFLVSDKLPYWTVCASHFSDEVCAFFSILRYMRQFHTFLDYQKLSRQQHFVGVNKYIMDEIHYQNSCL